MHKLKSVFRSSSKNRAEPTSPRSARGANSLDEQRPRQSSDSYHGGTHQNGRSRPLSSAYDSRSGSHPVVSNHAQSHSSELANESIASDYKAYLPVLSPVDDSKDESYMTAGGNRRLRTEESNGRHEEDVADRNIDQRRASVDVSKRKPLPATPVLGAAGQSPSHKHTTSSTIRSVPSAATGGNSAARDTTTRGGLTDRTRPHTEAAPRDSGHVDGEPRSLSDKLNHHEHPQSGSHGALAESAVGVHGQDEIHKEIEQLLEGVVDLRNTVDEDKEVTWAPAVTHEVVRPHEHEIIQHKIYREIHNYDHYYRIQPVYHIEVLPPRHWIPNPNGEGLIEISADELPSRTGSNRRWQIVHEHVDPSANISSTWRTQPAIIEHPTSITKEGFERKETTIIHPPTLQDMTDYDGLVQPVHFDHKTGKRWLGEITSMHKLRHELGQVADPALSSTEADPEMSLLELRDNLPQVDEEPRVPGSSQSPGMKRKSVSETMPVRQGQFGRPAGIAV